MENLEYRQHKSRKFMGLHNFYNSKMVVNGNWIVGIQPVARQQGIQADNDESTNEIFVLNRWTLELEKVLNAEHIQLTKLVNVFCYRSWKPQ